MSIQYFGVPGGGGGGPPSGAAGGDLGGSYPNPTVTRARGLRTSAGTTLAMGAVVDGEFLKRTGAGIVSAVPGGSGTVTSVTAGVGMTQTGTASVDPTLNVIANADGSIVANANDIQVGVLATDAQHGNRGGGGIHANVVAAGAAGFMTGADKSKLDGITAGAAVASVGAGAGLINSGSSTAVVLDVVANADGSIVVNANDLQVGVLASDAQHGNRGGGGIHANAIAGGAAGFMSGADKTKLDNLGAGATIVSFTAGAGVINSGTATAPILDVVAANTSIVVNADSIQLGTAIPTSATWTQAVSTSGSPSHQVFIGGAHTTLTASTEAIDWNFNGARTVQFSTGALTTQRAFVVQAPTYGFVGASTITTAATLAVSGPPVAGTNATITTAAALWIQAGNILTAGDITSTSSSTFTLKGNLSAANSGSDISFTTTVTRTAGGIARFLNNGTPRLTVNFHGGITVAQGAQNAAVPQLLSLTGASHTAMTLSTEVNFVDVNQGSVQWATGALTTQRCYRFRAPTLGFVGASTVTDTATLSIDAAPIAGTNATLTRSYALWVQAGASRFDGTSIGFLGAVPATQQTSGANLTNNVTSGGTDDTIANFTDLTIYSNDAAAIRNDIYQLSRKLKQINDGLRVFGLFS